MWWIISPSSSGQRNGCFRCRTTRCRCGGSCCSGQVARDQSPVEARQDVLVYTSDPFAETSRIVGDVDVTLSVRSSAPDTDLMVKLVDVDAAGRPYNLGDTAVRMISRLSS